jgi:hypothetical protein
VSGLLPDGFSALEPFAERWAGETAAVRAHLRDSASFADASAFYAAAQPLVQTALARLDATPLLDHGERGQRLMRLVLAFAHVSLAIEVQDRDESEHAKLRRHMPITRVPADWRM